MGPPLTQVSIAGAAKVARTKNDFLALKAAQAKSDIREKFSGGLTEVDPEVRACTPFSAQANLASCVARQHFKQTTVRCSCQGQCRDEPFYLCVFSQVLQDVGRHRRVPHARSGLKLTCVESHRSISNGLAERDHAG